MTSLNIDTLRALQERVRATTGPSEELDALIRCALLAPAESYVEQSKINGAWCIFNGEWNGRPKLVDRPRHVPHSVWGAEYTASIDAAVALIEKMLPDWRIERLMIWGEARVDLTEVDAEGWHYPTMSRAEGNGLTAPLALLDAMLSALIARSETGDAA